MKKLPTILESLHLVSKPILARAGFSYTQMGRKDYKFGVWTKELKQTGKGSFVLLPGFGDTPMSWFRFLIFMRKVLNANFSKVVFVDYPGFLGYDRSLPAFPSMDLLIEECNWLLEELRPDTLLGHSLGGWLGGWHCVLSEHKPRKVLLANPSGVLVGKEKQQVWQKVFQEARTRGIAAFRKNVFGKEPIWFGAIAREFDSFLFRNDINQFMDSVREDHLLNDRLRDVGSDVWLLWGEKDSLVPSEWARDWVAALGKGQIAFVKEVGHSPHVEAPHTFADLVSHIHGSKLDSFESYLLDKNPLRKKWQILAQ
ncbi:MAG: alpha/beta fold hydrolase [Bacteriovoracia bacterium]